MRNSGPILMLLLALGLFGGFAWLTKNPDTPWLEATQDWPLVGDLVTQFRTAYLGTETPGAPGQAATETDAAANAAARKSATSTASRTIDRAEAPQTPVSQTERSAATRERQSTSNGPATATTRDRSESLDLESDLIQLAEAEAAMAFDSVIRQIPGTGLAPRRLIRPAELPLELDNWLWILPGNAIRADSKPQAPVHERLSSMAFLPILGRRDPWVQVTFRDRQGWVDTSWTPPFQRRKATRGILRHRYEPIKASDSRKLKQARKLLRIERPSARLGDYTLFTDVEDQDLLAFLDLTARIAEDAYFARYGRLPSGDPKRSVVLFAKEADYRTFSELSRGLSGTQVGHAERGILSFFAEGRSRQALARTLVHEIGHLLNRRALAAFLPSWLEEGMASDLGWVWVEGTPNTKPDNNIWRRVFSLQGPEHSLLRLASTHEAGTLPSVAILMHLDHTKFHSSQAYSYAHSAAFVRYLAGDGNGHEGEPFRLFLKRIAAGRGAEPALLLNLLETDFEELDRRFRIWLVDEAEAVNQRLRVH